MQHIGTAANGGLSREDLVAAKARFEAAGAECELVDLRPAFTKCVWPSSAHESACILVVRQGGGLLANLEDPVAGAAAMEAEQAALEPDRRAWMRGRVVNKLARWNLCFADEGQAADLEARKGTIVPFSGLPVLSVARERLAEMFGNSCANLNAELNVYYDPAKCGIGFHGDAERKITIGIRLGTPIPFEYQWFLEGKSVGNRVAIDLKHGDLYAMGAKAVGTDWKRRKVPTLRHAAGAAKFLKVKT